MMLLTLRRATASFFFKEFDELINVFSDFSWLHFFAQFTAFIYRWPLNVTCWRASEHALPERRESAYDAVDGSHPTASQCAKVVVFMNHREIGAVHE